MVGYLYSASPIQFQDVTETIAGYISTLTSNAQDQLDGKAASTVVTDALTSDYNTGAKFKVLMSVT